MQVRKESFENNLTNTVIKYFYDYIRNVIHLFVQPYPVFRNRFR